MPLANRQDVTERPAKLANFAAAAPGTAGAGRGIESRSDRHRQVRARRTSECVRKPGAFSGRPLSTRSSCRTLPGAATRRLSALPKSCWINPFTCSSRPRSQRRQGRARRTPAPSATVGPGWSQNFLPLSAVAVSSTSTDFRTSVERLDTYERDTLTGFAVNADLQQSFAPVCLLSDRSHTHRDVSRKCITNVAIVDTPHMGSWNGYDCDGAGHTGFKRWTSGWSRGVSCFGRLGTAALTRSRAMCSPTADLSCIDCATRLLARPLSVCSNDELRRCHSRYHDSDANWIHETT